MSIPEIKYSKLMAIMPELEELGDIEYGRKSKQLHLILQRDKGN